MRVSSQGRKGLEGAEVAFFLGDTMTCYVNVARV